LLIGHTDTVRTHGWEERWAGTARESPFSGAVVDGAVWGRGASDLKAGICMTLEAVRTLDRAGLEVIPTLLFAFVGDEESGEPGSGVSAGARAFSALLARGDLPRPDMAIYVEPTMLDVYVAHMGFFLCDIRVIGKSAYFGVPELGVDALKGAHAVLEALWRYSAELSASAKHALVGSGFVLPTGIQGGGYIAVPGECTISMIVKIPPVVRLDDVRAGLETAARAASMDSRIELQFFYPAPRDHSIGGKPFESRLDEARLVRLISAVRAVRPERGNIEAAPYWSELPILSALGVPGVYFAPGDIRICHTTEENVSLQDYYDSIVALAGFLSGADYPEPARTVEEGRR
jgi:acetylornithine deacetylase